MSKGFDLPSNKHSGNSHDYWLAPQKNSKKGMIDNESKKVKVCFGIDRSAFEGVMFSMDIHDSEKREKVWDKLCESEIEVTPSTFSRMGMSDREMYTLFVCLAVGSKKEVEGILNEK